MESRNHDHDPAIEAALSPHLLVRARLADEARLPEEVEMILAVDPEIFVRASFLMGSTSRSRSAVLAMELSETDEQLRLSLALQEFASAALKGTLPLWEHSLKSLDRLIADLGLTEHQAASLRVIWLDQVHDETGVTVDDALRQLSE